MNLLKSIPFKPALKAYNDGAVTVLFSKLFQTSIQRFAKLKARQLTRLMFLFSQQVVGSIPNKDSDINAARPLFSLLVLERYPELEV